MLSKTKERPQKKKKKTRKRYQNLSEEEKNNKHQYAHERYKILYEEEKNKKCQYGHMVANDIKIFLNMKSKVEYRKHYSKMQKIKISSFFY